ncbi:hypothetical protein F4820DRAFT_453655 [Hypoxylon rubiginosum]|uniref:Uncharacterized protein n=1 Tax=Hypoxylon rubiginosum TaxID=110542 RepID=A0ACB9YJV8_9PEZI|nr:hypothetical protein F4820DRAFT_453655 [Hypoxylon rubiginosum]
MSWMDSWSRPGKSQATPAPYYLLPGGESTPYCRSCGRLISARRANAAAQQHDAGNGNSGSSNVSQKPSYCSQRCRNTKPRRLDRDIEAAFVRMLSEGEADGGTRARQQQDGKLGRSAKKERKVVTKGDPRVVVSCDAVEKAVFGDPADPDKSFGRKKNRASRALPAAEAEADGVQHGFRHREGGYALDEAAAQNIARDEDVDVDVDSDLSSSSIDGDVLARMAVRSGTRTRPPQHASLVNGSVGGEKGRAERAGETEETARRRLDGQRRARQREMVRSAARRGVVFGFAAVEVEGREQGQGRPAATTTTETTARKKCEAVMQGRVVEPSFAKGDWGVRWRE